MTTVRLFRDMIIGENGGDCLFDSEKINAQLKTIQDVSDEAYNKAIEDAITKAKIGLDHCELVDNRDGQALMNELISQFQSLKKKP